MLWQSLNVLQIQAHLFSRYFNQVLSRIQLLFYFIYHVRICLVIRLIPFRQLVDLSLKWFTNSIYLILQKISLLEYKNVYNSVDLLKVYWGDWKTFIWKVDKNFTSCRSKNYSLKLKLILLVYCSGRKVQ
jgi:hypothetical protein